MAKALAVKLFAGKLEYALSAAGACFVREFGYNGFANVWSKWQQTSDIVEFTQSDFERKCAYRLPDAPASRHYVFCVDIQCSDKPIVTELYTRHFYNDSMGAGEICYGLDEDGNFARATKY